MILLALLLFGLGAILAAVAQDMALMLVGRSVQGIGGGGVLVLVEIVVTDLVPLRWVEKQIKYMHLAEIHKLTCILCTGSARITSPS